MKKLEAQVEDDIYLEASMVHKSFLWRNNSGALKDETGRDVRFGLGNISKEYNKILKSSDRIGFTPIVITPEMVGKTIAVLTSIEVKKENWKYVGDDRETAQKNWIDLIKNNGGIAGFANSVDSYLKIVNDYMLNLKNRLD